MKRSEYALHAVDQSILKGITRREVEEAIASGEVIEDYPTDKYGPSCLICGFSVGGRCLQIQCTHPSRQRVKIITVYEPDAREWAAYRLRRP